MKKRNQNALRNVALFIGVLLLCFIMIEFAFRAFYPQITYSSAEKSSPRIYEKSAYLPWTLKPLASDFHIGVYGDFKVNVTINSQGLRDYERSVKKDRKRILVLGDSFTFGFGVEMNETYSKQLERMLNEKDNRYQVFNAGFAGGYSADSYYLYLKNKGMEEFDPDVVIIGFFPYNDLSDVAINEWQIGKDGLPVSITSKNYDVDSKNRLRSAKGGFSLLQNPFVNWVYRKLLTYSHFFSYVKKVFSSRVELSERNNIFHKEVPKVLDDAWNKNDAIYRAIKGLVKGKGASLVIVTIPVDMQVKDEKWAHYETAIGKDNVARMGPNEKMKEFANKEGIPLIDLTEKMRNLTLQGEEMFLPIDGHFNVHGHEVAGNEIAAYLRLKGMAS